MFPFALPPRGTCLQWRVRSESPTRNRRAFAESPTSLAHTLSATRWDHSGLRTGGGRKAIGGFRRILPFSFTGLRFMFTVARQGMCIIWASARRRLRKIGSRAATRRLSAATIGPVLIRVGNARSSARSNFGIFVGLRSSRERRYCKGWRAQGPKSPIGRRRGAKREGLSRRIPATGRQTHACAYRKA